jgi:hypothetical protein
MGGHEHGPFKAVTKWLIYRHEKAHIFIKTTLFILDKKHKARDNASYMILLLL